LAEIDARIRKAKKALKQLGYIAEDVSARVLRLHDWGNIL